MMADPPPSATPGAAPAPALDGVLALVQDRVSYLRAATAAPADDGWRSCADLCAGGPDLVALIDTTGAGRGTTDRQVAASLFVQAYAFRIAGVALAAYALDLDVPSVDPASTAILIGRHRPASIAFLDPVVRSADPDRLAADLLGGHLASFIAAVRREITVGERLLWGNVAASCATAFRAVEGEAADGDDAARVRARSQAFTAAAAPWFHGLGQYVELSGPARNGWFWERTNCCLWYQASGGSMCDDCSLLDAGERTAAWQAQLEVASA